MDGVEIGWLVCGGEGRGGMALRLHFWDLSVPGLLPSLGLILVLPGGDDRVGRMEMRWV